MIGFEVKVDPNQFGPELLKQWAFSVNNALARAAKTARSRCRQALRTALNASKEYKALFMEVGSPSAIGLQGELGIEDPNETVNAVVDAVVDALRIDVIKAKAKWAGLGSITDFGGLRVVIVPENLAFLLSLDEASYDSNGYEIEWLSWLLYSGTSVIISDYYVLYQGTGVDNPRSRTGDAIMVESGKTKKNFKIRPTYAGTAGNNWITRAGARAEPRIQTILTEELRNALS